MKNAILWLFRLRMDLGLVFVALPQTPIGAMIQKIKGVLAIRNVGRDRSLLILTLLECTFVVILLVCFFWYWRPKRHSREYFKDPADEALIEALEAKVGMLRMENQISTQQLAEANATNDDLVSALRASVVFDREITVTASDGGQHTFVFAGCEPGHGGDGFLGFYACPLCSERRLDAIEGVDPGESFGNHLVQCPGLRLSVVPQQARAAH